MRHTADGGAASRGLLWTRLLTPLLLALFLSRSAYPAPIRNPDNGHYYEAVARSKGITWDAARMEAEARTFNGLHGHLATLTSAAENDFVTGNLPQAIDGGYWLGGFQAHGLLDPAAGWQWITGEPWSFANWNTLTGSEPNDYEGPGTSHQDENKLQFWYFAGGTWNDVRSFDTSTGYVVEYEPATSPDAPVVTGYAIDPPASSSPNTASPGALLRVIGTHLGQSGTVLFDGVLLPAAAASWTPAEIRVWVPTAPAYPLQTHVTVRVDRQQADGPPLTIAAPTAGKDNLLANGSFEYPGGASSDSPVRTYGHSLYLDDSLVDGYSIPGWRIPIGTIDVYRTAWQIAPGQGSQSIDLVGSPFAATIAQTIYTEPGQQYDFSGWMSHNPAVTQARADVYLNDQFFVQLFHARYNSAASMNWTPFLFRFRAIDTQTTLSIQDVTGRTYYHGTALDGLSVTPAPN